MPCINKNNLLLVSLFLIFFAFSSKTVASETNDYIAESHYKQYLKNFYYEQGKEFYYHGNLQDAILKFQLALKCDPEYKPAQLFLKLINEKIAQRDSLEERKIKSQKQKKEESGKKNSTLNYYKEGISYFKKANYREAINKFKESLKLTPDYEPALRYRVLSEDNLAQQIKTKQEQKIIEEQKEEARIKEQFADFNYQQGKDYFNLGKYDQAILKLKQALEFVSQYKPALKYIALSEHKIAEKEKREQEKLNAEKKKREQEETEQKLIALQKEAREKLAKKIKEEEVRREKRRVAKKETVKKISQEVKDKAGQGYITQVPVVENAVPAQAAAGTISQQQKQEEEKKLAENKMKEEQGKEAKVQAAIRAAKERVAQRVQENAEIPVTETPTN